MMKNPDNLELNPDEVICDKCNGYVQTYSVDCYDQECSKCLGSGKLNWLENIFGKKKRLAPKVSVKEVDTSKVIPKINSSNFWDTFIK